MQVFNLGSDRLSFAEVEEIRECGYEWIVYWYKGDPLEGDGEFVGLAEDGLIHVKNLRHCSCWGPMDDWATGVSFVTREEYLRDKDSIFDLEVRPDIDAKVKQLLA